MSETTSLNKEQQAQLETLASSMLDDDEIMAQMSISEEQLIEYYDIVERARLALKQKLNGLKLKNAVAGKRDVDNIDNIINKIPRNNNLYKEYRYKGTGHGPYTNKAPSRGGARVGAGRPPGSINKLTGAKILASIEQAAGKTFEQLLAEGYLDSISTKNYGLRFQYEKLFLGKVVSDKVAVVQGVNEELIEGPEYEELSQEELNSIRQVTEEFDTQYDDSDEQE